MPQYEITTLPSMSEMDEADSNPLDPDNESFADMEAELMGLSRASLKKYSSPARKRIEARQRAAALMGFSFKKLDPRAAIKKISKEAKKLDMKKVNKVAQAVGPLVAVAYPPAAPAVAVALPVLNAVANKDAAALAAVAATKVAAEAGSPEAIQTMETLKAAQAVRKNVQAGNLLASAASGNLESAARVEAIKAAKDYDPEAASSYRELERAANTARVAPQVKAASARGTYRSEDFQLPEPEDFTDDFSPGANAMDELTETTKIPVSPERRKSRRDCECE